MLAESLVTLPSACLENLGRQKFSAHGILEHLQGLRLMHIPREDLPFVHEPHLIDLDIFLPKLNSILDGG